MRIITICGSLKYQREMMIEAEKLSLNGDCVLTPVYLINQNFKIDNEKLKRLKNAHFKRIELSDAIYVINKDNYIGDSTKSEIDYARKLGKDIIYYND